MWPHYSNLITQALKEGKCFESQRHRFRLCGFRIMRLFSSGLHQNNRPQFRAGETIKLVEGPFAGMEAVFTEEDGEKRVIVLLELLGKTNKVRVARDWVSRSDK